MYRHMDEKNCSICGKKFPVNKDNFRHRVKDGKAYFSAECIICARNEVKKSNARRKQRRQAALERVEQAGVDMFLKSVTKGGSNVPHSAEVIERVFDYFGGVSGFSAVLVKQYWDATPGGSARNRLLETMCRLVSKNVEQGGAKKPLQLWSEDELEQELQQRLIQAATVITGEVEDGEETYETKAFPYTQTPEGDATAAANAADADAVRTECDQGTTERNSGQET